jgi:PAS domain-containing protein
VQSIGEPFLDNDGRIAHWYGVIADIDERKQAEQAVQESEEHLRLIIDTIPALVWRAAPTASPARLSQ